jgi:alkylation response protein AidB-like acyl-CoA dehydrogenase
MRANHEILMNPGLLALGIARAAFDAILEIVVGGGGGQRTAALAQQQVTRFALADLDLRLGTAYAYAASVASTVATGGDDAALECSKLKLWASAAAADVSATATQLAGSRGFRTDCPLERYLRDARATLLMGPSNDLIRERIADRLIDDDRREATA